MARGFVQSLNLFESQDGISALSILNNLAGDGIAEDVKLFANNLGTVTAINLNRYSIQNLEDEEFVDANTTPNIIDFYRFVVPDDDRELVPFSNDEVVYTISPDGSYNYYIVKNSDTLTGFELFSYNPLLKIINDEVETIVYDVPSKTLPPMYIRVYGSNAGNPDPDKITFFEGFDPEDTGVPTGRRTLSIPFLPGKRYKVTWQEIIADPGDKIIDNFGIIHEWVFDIVDPLVFEEVAETHETSSGYLYVSGESPAEYGFGRVVTQSLANLTSGFTWFGGTATGFSLLLSVETTEDTKGRRSWKYFKDLTIPFLYRNDGVLLGNMVNFSKDRPVLNDGANPDYSQVPVDTDLTDEIPATLKTANPDRSFLKEVRFSSYNDDISTSIDQFYFKESGSLLSYRHNSFSSTLEIDGVLRIANEDQIDYSPATQNDIPGLFILANGQIIRAFSETDNPWGQYASGDPENTLVSPNTSNSLANLYTVRETNAQVLQLKIPGPQPTFVLTDTSVEKIYSGLGYVPYINDFWTHKMEVEINGERMFILVKKEQTP